jgi:hypothetical protein
MLERAPYLSVVVAARNDDHGGNLLGRMQTFFNAWVGACKKHGLSSELIIVEWNPPADKPSLSEALRCPSDPGPCSVRFIEVPSEIHSRYRYAEVLPLYQMIAKNVGIRRARGEFVLATNIDILFSEELVRHIAERGLRCGRMYRVDRYDVMSEVPVDDSVHEQLAYCRSHLLRINAREGTYRLTPDGRRALEDQDIAGPESGVSFGRGWFPVERYSEAEVFRWVENDAEVLVRIPHNPPPPLHFDIEAGPGVGRRPFQLQIVDTEGVVQAWTDVNHAARITVRLPSDGQAAHLFRFRVIGGGFAVSHDPRILNFRVFHCGWGKSPEADDAEEYQLEAGSAEAYRLEAGKPLYVHHGVPSGVTPKLAKAYRFCLEAGGLWKGARAGVGYYLRSKNLPVKLGESEDIFEHGAGIWPGPQWYPLEHYLGETFRWVRKEAQLFVRSPKVIQNRDLTLVIEPGPGVGYGSFELLVRNEEGKIVARAPVRGLLVLDLQLPLEPGKTQMFRLTLEGGDLPAARDPRILNFRLFWCGWSKLAAANATRGKMRKDLTVGSKPWEDSAGDAEPANCSTPVYLHTNGCGDFTLMAREHWFDLRGYPEFDVFSMNLDSVLCYSAHHAGFREEILREPMQIYHIEHETGSGWTPEGQAQLFARLAAKGLPVIDYREVVDWAAQMRRLNSPMIFNRENWGLADLDLRETILSASHVLPAVSVEADRV